MAHSCFPRHPASLCFRGAHSAYLLHSGTSAWAAIFVQVSTVPIVVVHNPPQKGSQVPGASAPSPACRWQAGLCHLFARWGWRAHCAIHQYQVPVPRAPLRLEMQSSTHQNPASTQTHTHTDTEPGVYCNSPLQNLASTESVRYRTWCLL